MCSARSTARCKRSGRSVINDVQHVAYSAYIRSLADVMGLRDWEIDLAREYAEDPDTGAQCQTTYGRKIATIVFGQGFLACDPETQRYYCVHELLHCHTCPVHTAVANACGRLGSDAFSILDGTHRDAIEFAVDGIGVAYAKFLPLPPTLDGEDSRELPPNVVQFTPERAA